MSLAATRMDLEGVMLSEISHTERQMISLMWNLKIQKTNDQTKQNETHGYREQIGGCQKWGGVSKMGERGQKVQTCT